MNAYYNFSDKGTVAQENVGRRIIPQIKIGSGFFEFLCSIIAILLCPVAVKLEKGIACTLGFVAILGVVGAMEIGAIGIFAGVLICAALALISFLLLRSITRA